MNAPAPSPPPERRPLFMWTVYDHPADHPDFYVARLFKADGGRAYVSTSEYLLSPDLITLREALVVEKGMSVRLDRQPGDNPVIVEVWL